MSDLMDHKDLRVPWRGIIPYEDQGIGSVVRSLTAEWETRAIKREEAASRVVCVPRFIVDGRWRQRRSAEILKRRRDKVAVLVGRNRRKEPPIGYAYLYFEPGYSKLVTTFSFKKLIV